MEMINFLLEISVYSVLLFVIILLIKHVLREKMSPTLHFILWFIPVARLCIPFTINSSIRPFVIQKEGTGALQGYEHIQKSTQLNTADYIVVLWLSGIIILSIRMIINMIKMRKMVKRNGVQPSSDMEEILSRSSEELGIKRKIKIIMLPFITTPALTIEPKPKLVLPTDIQKHLNEKQLELVIKHELTHYKRRDHRMVMLLRVLEIVYWFNPLVWVMGRYISHDMEAACDSMVVKNLDNQLRKHYALSLVQLSSKERMIGFVLGLVFGNNEKEVENRVRKVFQKSPRKPGAMIGVSIITVVLIAGSFTTILQPVVKSDRINNNQVNELAYNHNDPKMVKDYYIADADDIKYIPDGSLIASKTLPVGAKYTDLDQDSADPDVYTTDLSDAEGEAKHTMLPYVDETGQEYVVGVVLTKVSKSKNNHE